MTVLCKRLGSPGNDPCPCIPVAPDDQEPKQCPVSLSCHPILIVAFPGAIKFIQPSPAFNLESSSTPPNSSPHLTYEIPNHSAPSVCSASTAWLQEH